MSTVYVVYASGRKRVWVKNPAFYSDDDCSALFFTPVTISVGFLTSKFPPDIDYLQIGRMAQDKLDEWNIPWSNIQTPRFACRSWRNVISEVCLVDFSILGPLPAEIGAQCDGEQVAKPKGKMVCYGG